MLTRSHPHFDLIKDLKWDKMVEAHQKLQRIKKQKDGRKNQIKKEEYIAFTNAITFSFHEYNLVIKSTRTFRKVNKAILKNVYPRLTKEERQAFLRDADNALLLIFCNELKIYPTRGGIEPLSELNPNHINNIKKKMEEDNYTLPDFFKAPEIVFEDIDLTGGESSE